MRQRGNGSCRRTSAAARGGRRPRSGKRHAGGTGRHRAMRIDGVNGGSATPISSFSLGAANSISTSDGSGAGAGKVTFSNLAVLKTLDGDLVPLLQAAATGQVFHTLSIDVFNGGSRTPFATYTFEDV